MFKEPLWSISEAAKELDTDRDTLRGLIKARKIATKPMVNGKAKGLDRSDMEVLAKALGREPESHPAMSA